MNPFHVITESKELEGADYGVTASRVQEVAASRDVSTTNFPGKQISYKFSTSANEWWSPSESMLRARVKLTAADGSTTLAIAGEIAPRAGLMANLFQSLELRINGVVVSRCTDNVAAVDAYLHRSTKSGAWMKSIGAAVNLYGETYAKRRADVSSDGVLTPDASATAINARRVQEFELTWDLAVLSIFMSEQNIPPGCDIELVLNPYGASQYKNNAVESTAAVTPGAGNDFDFSVEDMIFYAKVYEGMRYDDGMAIIDLDNTRCQAESNISTGFGKKMFDVSPSTHTLAVAFQDTALTDSSHSASEFVVSKTNQLQNNLTRLFINYDGQSKPQPDASPEFKTGTDYTVQRYLETQNAIGALKSEAGGETLEDWQRQGAYYAFKWQRDGNSQSTRCGVNTQFSAALTNGRMLLFDTSYANVRMEFQNGRCVQVLVEDL
jgi:hypothetical protein